MAEMDSKTDPVSWSIAMIRFEPCLIVKRLVIKRGAHIAYDEAFHSGVNVVRGDNSSGKSTVLNFLFYGLGGDLDRTVWSEHALYCDYVWVEVEFNGNPAVLRREINVSSQSPMEIHTGRYEDALKAPVEGWLRYPYARSKNQESFSQAIFRLLGMPDVAVEGTSSVTVHQILRLLYADQMSPTDSLFRFEGYDPENLREAVGNLLCGAFDAEIYELQQLKKVRERELTDISAELRSIFRVIGGGDDGMSLGWVEKRRAALLDEQVSLLERISKAEEEFYSGRASDRITLQAQKELYKEVQLLQAKIQQKQAAISSVELDIADSSSFIRSLQARLEAIRDARLAADVVHTIHFGTCPACYAEVIESDHDIGACPLCKTPLEQDRVRARVVGIINELAVQIKQSERLQQLRADRLSAFKSEMVELQAKWRSKAKRLDELNAIPTSKAKEELRELQRQLGYVDKSLEDIVRQLRLANKIGDLSSRKEHLDTEIQEISARISGLQLSQTERLKKARTSIEKYVIEFLRGDLKRQDSFENPEHINFSFAKNVISVDDHTYFSASSRVVLKSAFLVGFLQAAMNDPLFRHPRFLMIDITEDKGMEQERSYNFQRQIIAVSRDSRVEHQIIVATAMPWPGMDAGLVVGRHSTRQRGTLNFQ